MNSVFLNYLRDDELHRSQLGLDQVKSIYGAMDGLQSVTVIERTNGEKIILHWHREITFSQDGVG